ncbi:MAG: glucosyltransferase domain-containing protein [Candidatus Microsaccharimonas sp.]
MTTLFDRIKFLSQPSLSSKKVYSILLIVAALFVYPIINANLDYIDDNARRVDGSFGWYELGRVATEGLIRIFTFSTSTFLSNPGQLLQILSIPVLAAAGLYFLKAVMRGSYLSWNSILVGALVVANPFLVANIVFRYDSLSMVTAYFLAIFAGYLVVNGARTPHYLLGTLLLFITMLLYQPMVLMFLLVIICSYVYIYLSEAKRRDVALVANKIFLPLGVFMAGVVVYFAFTSVMHFSNLGTSDRGGLVAFNRTGLLLVVDNLKNGIKVSGLFLYPDLIKLSVATLFVVAGILVAVRAFVLRHERTIWSSLLLFLTPLALVLSIMGPFVLLQSQITFQVRTLAAGIGLVVCAVVVVVTMVHIQRYTRFAAALVLPVIIVLYCISFSFTYAATLKTQREFDALVYDEVQDYIIETEKYKESFVIGGELPYTQSVQLTIQRHPIMQLMNVSSDNSRWYIWSEMRNTKLVRDATLFTGTSDQAAFVSDVCKDEARYTLDKGNYFTVYRLNNGTNLLWFNDPSGFSPKLCSI